MVAIRLQVRDEEDFGCDCDYVARIHLNSDESLLHSESHCRVVIDQAVYDNLALQVMARVRSKSDERTRIHEDL